MMEARLEKQEPTPGEMETVAEHQEVTRKRVTHEEKIGEADDRSGDQRLAVRRRRHLSSKYMVL
jgi:phage terminase small subunit